MLMVMWKHHSYPSLLLYPTKKINHYTLTIEFGITVREDRCEPLK